MTRGDVTQKRFAADVMLGKLAKWLRMLGFDTRVTLFRDRAQIESFLARARIPVTRRQTFQGVPGVLFLRQDRHFEQLRELICALHLERSDIRPFTRCSICNTELLSIPREDAFGRVPDFVFETAGDFRKCPECEKLYWPGSHKGRMLDKLESVVGWNIQSEEEQNG